MIPKGRKVQECTQCGRQRILVGTIGEELPMPANNISGYWVYNEVPVKVCGQQRHSWITKKNLMISL